MLGKRMPNLSFMIFATGFQFVLLVLFVWACDRAGWQLGVFRTLGTNPLAAYFIHGIMALALALALPHYAPLTWCVAGFAAAFLITYLLVRVLENADSIGGFEIAHLRTWTSFCWANGAIPTAPGEVESPGKGRPKVGLDRIWHIRRIRPPRAPIGALKGTISENRRAYGSLSRYDKK